MSGGGRKKRKENTSGGHSSGQAFIAVGTMSLDDVICAQQTPIHLFTEDMETDIRLDMFHLSAWPVIDSENIDD